MDLGPRSRAFSRPRPTWTSWGGLNARNQTRALVFNTKGEDLLHIDQRNKRWNEHPEAAEQWARLGVPAPGPFTSVRLYAPRADSQSGTVVADVRTRGTTEVLAYGWTPEQFVRLQLQFCFTAEDDRTTQVGLVEQQLRSSSYGGSAGSRATRPGPS